MPVDSVHPMYAARSAQWKKCRDVFEGEDAIKHAGTRYLPKLKGQSAQDYRTYKDRALFYSILSKTVSSLTGLAATKAPEYDVPDSLKKQFDGSSQTAFDELYVLGLSELLLQSRVGIFIDFPAGGGEPYPSIYAAEDILNWRVDEDGKPTLVVLREMAENVSSSDEFETDLACVYRVLRLDSGKYIQEVYDEDLTLVDSIPYRAFDEIPFIAVHPFGIGFRDYKPQMLDIANINISHYRTSADLEHGRHFTGLPTPVIIGASTDVPMFIGSTKFLVIPNHQAKAQYLEFTGQGLQSLEKAMSEKMTLLASLSARLLDNSARGSEAAEAVKLRYSSESSSLATNVKAMEVAIRTAYRFLAQANREDPDSVKLTLSTQFMDSPMTAAELTALFNGLLGGAISVETLVYNLKRGQRMDPTRSDAEEVTAINQALNAARSKE